MVRVNLKLKLLLVFIAALLVALSMWTRCDSHPLTSLKAADDGASPVDVGLQGYEEIDCSINAEYTVGCRKEGGEVYVPFSFLRKYFEVYGKMASYDGLERFEWSHSYSKVYYPKGKYDPRGVFLYFENYNVEVRERVKCVSGIDGVPVSIQWQSEGYLYPIQIAQFGLSHYSKNLTEPEPRRRLIEDAEKTRADWSAAPGSSVLRVFDEEVNSKVLRFQAREAGVRLAMDHVLDLVLSLSLSLSPNSSLSVTLSTRDRGEKFHLHYTSDATLLRSTGQHTSHGVGEGWKTLTRDLLVDLQKGMMAANKRRKISRSKLKVVEMTLSGAGSLDNVSLSSSEHMAQFYDAADWFVRSQDPMTGGWANHVTRHLTAAIADLQPGWYSAMGQGHALSVLARAYHHSGGNSIYLDAALRGLKPFQVASKQGGVRAMFMDKYPWFEEYPTDPPTFVLNGFIYSLLGLYDLTVIGPPAVTQLATQLFDTGMVSLKHLLLLYDTGSGSSYDLRHVSLGSAPNLARWDYHATHVNQLLLLATIDPDPLLSATAERWIGYMAGKRANHN